MDAVECGIYAVDFIRDELREGVVYEIDGSAIQTLQDYFDVSSCVFGFPVKGETMWDQYFDWIRDFAWLPEDVRSAPISVFITHYPEMLKDDYENKQLLINSFYKVVFPYWAESVTHVTGGHDKPRSFKVYLMAGDGTKEGQDRGSHKLLPRAPCAPSAKNITK